MHNRDNEWEERYCHVVHNKKLLAAKRRKEGYNAKSYHTVRSSQINPIVFTTNLKIKMSLNINFNKCKLINGGPQVPDIYESSNLQLYFSMI